MRLTLVEIQDDSINSSSEIGNPREARVAQLACKNIDPGSPSKLKTIGIKYDCCSEQV